MTDSKCSLPEGIALLIDTIYLRLPDIGDE
jgi:hypothetical protein